MGRRRATRRRKWAAESVCSRPSGLGSERCAPEAASAATSWGSRQHGAVGAVPAPEARSRPGPAPQPRGLRRAAALVRVHARPGGSQRPAAQPGCAAGHGAAHRHPPAGAKEELPEGLCGSGRPPRGHALPHLEQNRQQCVLGEWAPCPPRPQPQPLLPHDERTALSSRDAGFKVNALKRWSTASPSPYPLAGTLLPHPSFPWQKLMRLPGGPTLTFQINKYTLVRDVVSSLRRHRMHEQQFNHPPLLVLNSFGPQGMHIKLMATMFQNLFPSINVHTVNLNTIKRCLLINYNPDSQELDFRHYSIKVVPVGASRGMKKLLQEKFPNMSRLQDISELLATGAGLSESEVEPDGEHNITELPQAVAGRGNMQAQQSAIRLTEIGPRMTLQLIKIQEGVGTGNVLFHSFVHKTEEELQAILAAKEEKLRLKAQRQNQQAANLERKRELREAHKKKSLAGMKRARAGADGDSDAEDPGPPPEAVGASHVEEEEDDAEYFRQAVGEEPDEDMFPRVAKRRRQGGPPGKRRGGQVQRPGSGRGKGGNWRPPKPKGRPQGVKTKPGPRAARQDPGRPSRRGT